jgi:hypothetical protein
VVRGEVGLVMIKFGAGFILGFWILSAILVRFYIPSSDVMREATLPPNCLPGAKVLMTTAPKAEYYECEAHWVRK